MNSDGKIVNIPIDQLNADFTDDTEPRDDRLIELLKQAYTQKIACRRATIGLTDIHPYSNYRPVVSESFRRHFTELLESDQPMPLLVYEKGGRYIMSDDYSAYSLYLENKVEPVSCIILDPSNVSLKLPNISEPFYLQLPTAEIIE